MPNTIEIVPRNMVWVEDMPPDFGDYQRSLLTQSYFTHAIVCFFHLDAGPKLVYNGPNDPDAPQFKDWWPYLRTLGEAKMNKTLVMSVGGWNSNTWGFADGHEAEGAAQIVDFARAQGFDGIDFNFEGDYGNVRAARLATCARLIVKVHKIWDGLLTITPIYGEQEEQLEAIAAAFGRKPGLLELLTCVNVQFYTYAGPTPQPMWNVIRKYFDVVLYNSWGMPVDMVTAGFPLSETDPDFNKAELETALDVAGSLYYANSTFGGVFAWRFKGVFLGSRAAHLNWAENLARVLNNRR
jgi:hypothetical protein